MALTLVLEYVKGLKQWDLFLIFCSFQYLFNGKHKKNINEIFFAIFTHNIIGFLRQKKTVINLVYFPFKFRSCIMWSLIRGMKVNFSDRTTFNYLRDKLNIWTHLNRNWFWVHKRLRYKLKNDFKIC